MLRAKKRKVFPTNAQDTTDKVWVEVGILEARILEPRDEVRVASGKAAESPKKNLGYECIRWLVGFDGESEGPVRILDGINRLENGRHERFVVLAGSEFSMPERLEVLCRQSGDHVQVDRVVELQKEARPPIHAPACQIKTEHQGG